MPTDLVVHDVEDQLVLILEQRAAANGRSIEAEHREILKAALQRPQHLSVKDVLANMPDGGEDTDFDVRNY